MRIFHCVYGSIALLAVITSVGLGADVPADSPSGKNRAALEENAQRMEKRPSEAIEGPPVSLTANDMSIATGQPSLVLMSSGSTHIPVWSLSGGTVGQSVAGTVNGFPREYAAVKVEIVVTTTDEATRSDHEDVYRVHLSQMVENAPFTARQVVGDSVRTTLPPAPFHSRTIVLESYYPVEPDAPLSVRIQREPADPADTFTHPTGLAMVKVTPLAEPAKPRVVQASVRYDSWPMIQAIGKRLVCAYSRGSGHTIGEDARAVYARTSTDEGKTWTAETVVANTPGYGEVTVGKGLDSKGAMLLWVRRVGKTWIHDLYRTTDGMTFELIATPKLDVAPVQITDVFHVPTVGLMALWFAGNYGDDGPNHSWGTLTSNDNGITWKQTVIESELTKDQWPTEPAAVYLGDGRILAVGRTEIGGNSTVRSQFQMVSSDYGATWNRAQTNIGDVLISTPTLILDAKTGLLSNYYYQRGRGILRRRVVDPDSVFDDPLNWPASEAVATGSRITVDAGNANATVIGNTHFVSFYSGEAPHTSILVSALPAPPESTDVAEAPEKDGFIINAHPEPEYGSAIPFRKVPGTAGSLALEISGGRLYALESRGLSIYDIDDPKHPKKLGHVGGMGNVRQLRVRGKTAFLTSRQCGLWAVDVSDEANPKIISNFDAVEMATGLDVAGDVAFIGNRVYGIQCVDVSDPAQMKHLSSYRTDESQSVSYRDNLLFSGDWAGGEVTVIDVSNLAAPKAISSMKLDGYGDGIAIRGHTLFASTGQHKKSGPETERHGAGHGLDIFDISDPHRPVKLSKIKFPTYYFGPCDYWMPRIVGNRCFASDTINGLFVVDISNLKQPKILGNLVLPKTDPENPNIGIPYKQIQDPTIPQGDSISSIAIGDGVLYMSGSYTGIYLAEFPDQARLEPKDRGALPKLPAQPYQGESTAHFHSSGPELSNPTRGVALHGDIAYTANVWDGLKIYQLSENAVKQIGKVDIAYAADVKRSGDRLYVAEGQNGIGVYQIKSPTKVSEIGRLDVLETPLNFVQFLWAFDGSDTIAATCAGTKVSFINFADPAKPEIIHSTSGSQLLYGSYGSQHLVKDRYFAIARHCGGLMAFDLKSNPVKDLWYDTFPLCSQTGGVAAFGDKLLVMRAGGYAFFDPEHPVSTKELTRNKFPGQVQLPDDVPDDSAISRALFPKTEWEGLPNYDSNSRKLAIVNRMFKNLHIYDFTDPAHPKLLKRIPLSSNVYPPVFWQGRVVLPGGYSGLLLEKE